MYVLVHGVAHGAWCWERTRTDLVAAGHEVVALDLALTSLADDASIVVDALDRFDGPKILVGHSYGGLVISKAAGERADVEHLVYVAAIMLDGDQLFTDVGAEFDATELAGALVIGDDGTFTVAHETALVAFYNECSHDDARNAAAQLRPTSITCVMSPAGAEPWRTIPSTYVVCERDQAIDAAMQRSMAQRATKVVVLDTDHSPFLSRPKEFLAVLTAG